ncbi:MAG TPA: hypothetical protein VHA74_00430 [Candidatus Dojkabacteria bacterium]|nr:hypothetical protein [Candidatus Dojkabacteria bacterium]
MQSDATFSKSIEVNDKTAVERLLDYEKQGYLFHGSTKNNLSIIEPKSAKDVNDKEEFNNDNAVFASVSAAGSVIFGCMYFPEEIDNKVHGAWSVGPSRGIGKIWAQIPKGWKEYIKNNRGYVYVLKRDPFIEGLREGFWQAKSKTPVVPVDIIQVQFSDYEKLGGFIEWSE